MSNTLSISVPVRWILGEPTEAPITHSVQGFDSWIANPEATVLCYRGGFEIVDTRDGDKPFVVIWLNTDFAFSDLHEAEAKLAELIVTDGCLTDSALSL